MERARMAFAGDKRDDFVFVLSAASTSVMSRWFASRNLAVIGFVGFDWSTAAAKQAAACSHRFTNAVRHEPSGLVRHAERAVQLVRAHAFLGGADEIHGLQPHVQLDL